MIWKSLKVGLIVVVCLEANRLGALFAWTGAGSNDDWDNCDNWDAEGLSSACYPSDWHDDANIDGGC